MRRSARDSELDRLRLRVDLEDRLRRTLDVIDAECDALALVDDALTAHFGSSIRLVVPDPALMGLGPARVVNDHRQHADTNACIAFRRGVTVVVPSNTQFDACGHLRETDRRLSGVCVPLGVGGTEVGVIQWTGTEHHPLDRADIDTVEMVAHLLASRVLLLRSATAEQPRTDPLTGLLNPHSTMQAILGLVGDLTPFSLAVCTLDGFEAYTDTHGHDTGDHALRLFARSLTNTVRPNDVVGRSDLDQFTIVFPATSALDAAQALERVRETVVLSLAESDIPQFTATFGVSDSNQGTSIEAIIETAERAVDMATDSGGNRVVVAGEDSAPHREHDD